jgi:hypothetical protein
VSGSGAALRQETGTQGGGAQSVLDAIGEAVAAVRADPGSDRAVAELVRAGILAGELRDAFKTLADNEFCLRAAFDAGAEFERARVLAARPSRPARRPVSGRSPLLNVLPGGLETRASR